MEESRSSVVIVTKIISITNVFITLLKLKYKILLLDEHFKLTKFKFPWQLTKITKKIELLKWKMKANEKWKPNRLLDFKLIQIKKAHNTFIKTKQSLNENLIYIYIVYIML